MKEEKYLDLLQYIEELVHQYELTFKEYRELLDLIKDEDCSERMLLEKTLYFDS